LLNKAVSEKPSIMHDRLLLSFIVFLLCGGQALASEYTLAWDPNQEPSLAGYNLYALPEGSPDGFMLWKSVELTEIDPENPRVTVAGFDKQRKYTFFMTACDDSGNESPGSNSACGLSGSSCTAADNVIPNPPDEGWRLIGGSVTVEDDPVCAAVLVNGQHVFSCDPEQGLGNYRLVVPLDENNTITVQAFADGLAPFKWVGATSVMPIDIAMQPPLSGGKEIDMTRVPERDAMLPEGWARISGTVRFGNSPVCAMVLANGQHAFSCGPYSGQYGLSAPLDPKGQITIFVFAHGFQPHKETFTPTW